METSRFIRTSGIGQPDWYNKFRDQNSLLNKSSAKILLIGDSIISNLGRCSEIWKNRFSHHNTFNFGIPGDKIQHVLWRKQNLNFSSDYSI